MTPFSFTNQTNHKGGFVVIEFLKKYYHEKSIYNSFILLHA